jgi:hypothetical protein
MLTNRIAVVIKEETTAGTRVEPIVADNDVVFFEVGMQAPDLGIEQKGNIADGSFNKARVTVGKHAFPVSDLPFYINRPAANNAYPKWVKLAKLSNGKEGTKNGRHAIIWDNKQTCATASYDVYLMECATATKYMGRGGRGNLTIGFDGSNAPFMGTFGGLNGAYVGKTDIATSAIPALGTVDTRAPETAGNYILTIGGAVYQAHSFSFNPNCETSLEGGNNASGIVKAKSTNGDLKVSFSVTMLNSADNVIADAIAGTVFSEITMIGSGLAGFDVIITDAQFSTSPAMGDVDGTVTWDVELQCKEFAMVYRVL